MSLASGSSGNSYYLATDDSAILIDAGKSFKIIKKDLEEAGQSFDKIRAVLVTHDHADHINSLLGLTKRCFLPVYATAEVHQGISQSYCLKVPLEKAFVRYITKEQPIEIGEFRVTPFEVPHDSTDCVGYKIEVRGVTFVFVTDLGHITDTAAKYIVEANYLIMEANHDETMLINGKYPAYLKQRILGPKGHLSNRTTAEFLSSNFPKGLKHIFLCHLSRENNHPALAYKTVELTLREKGIVVGRDVGLTALKRTQHSEVFIVEE